MTTPPTRQSRITLLAAAATLTCGLFCGTAQAATPDSSDALPSLKGLSISDNPDAAPSLRDRVVRKSMDALGTLYHWGGDDPNEGFDCSGLVRFVFRKTAGMTLPRTSREQRSAGESVGRQQLLPGDLVFFNGTTRTRVVRAKKGHHKSLRTVVSNVISHVGIYIGDNQFIHSPVRGERVRIDNLDASYWAKHYAGASRYLTPQAIARAQPAPDEVDDADDTDDQP